MVLWIMNLPNNAEDLKNLGSIPGQEDALEEEMATRFSILVWKIPRTEELQSTGSQKVDTTEPT